MAALAEDAVIFADVISGDRIVAYSVAGPVDGAPVAVFYPAGGNRRMLRVVRSALQPQDAATLRLICVNRPGKGATSEAPVAGDASTASAHVAAACSDLLAVLDSLAIPAASLAFMCAGAPFALAFATRHPERTSGRLVGISPWILPRDSEDTSVLYRLGAQLPSWLVCPVVAGSMAGGGALGSLPQSVASSLVLANFTSSERALLVDSYPDPGSFMEVVKDIGSETGGEVADVEVCLSGAKELGIDYGTVFGHAVLYHGTGDTVVSMASVEWLGRQLPSATLRRIENASHNGAIMMIDPQFSSSFASVLPGAVIA